jgi:peptidoglycan/LPS O-acetylase OafA/YrhL
VVVDTPIVAGAPARKTYFDLLRLGAAAAVLFSHSYALVGRGEPGLGSQSIGNIAVLVFFAISGFLIAGSWRSEPRLPLFLAKRVLRIMPALLAVLLLSAFALGPVVSNVALGTYLSDMSVYKYVGANAVMHTTYGLPGVFADNAMPGVVNGSLWTLKHEVLCYVMIAGLGFAGLLRNRWVATAVLVGAVFSFALAGAHGPAFFDQSTLERTFCIAALMQVWRDRIVWSWAIALVGLAAWIALASTAAGSWLVTLAIPYATIVAAGLVRPGAERWLGGNDVSYGVYLWAFPVQQVLVSAWHGVSPLALSLLALPLTALIALASWKLVEHPALLVKSRLAGHLRGRRSTPSPLTIAPEPAPSSSA